MSRADGPLTDNQLKFLDAYFGEAEGNAMAAYKIAYPNIPRPSYDKVGRFKSSAKMKDAIEERKKLREHMGWLAKDDVLDGLYKEATNSKTNASARISAWVWIGKHLGMWQEKKEEKQDRELQITIQQYGDSNIKVKDKKGNEQSAIIEQSPVPDNIKVLDYSNKVMEK